MMTKKAMHEAAMAAKAAAKAAKIAAEKARIEANPIYAAIAPQKAEAVARAGQQVDAYLRSVVAKLLGTDLRESAPRPRSFNFHGSREAYRKQLAFHSLAVRITACTADVVTGPEEAAIARFVADEEVQAGFSFDAYVAKLTAKVGACESATVEGPLWNYSRLTVNKGTATEVWKTQQIVNVSVLGKLFNQWPTRRVV